MRLAVACGGIIGWSVAITSSLADLLAVGSVLCLGFYVSARLASLAPAALRFPLTAVLPIALCLVWRVISVAQKDLTLPYAGEVFLAHDGVHTAFGLLVTTGVLGLIFVPTALIAFPPTLGGGDRARRMDPIAPHRGQPSAPGRLADSAPHSGNCDRE